MKQTRQHRATTERHQLPLTSLAALALLTLVSAATALGQMPAASSTSPVITAQVPAVPASSATDDEPTQNVTLYFGHGKSLSIPGLTNAVSLEDSVCRVEVQDGRLMLSGVSRGDVPVILWVGDKQQNMLVHVVEEPYVAPPPSLMRNGDAFAAGFFRTTASMNLAGQSDGANINTQFGWNQNLGAGKHLMFQATTLDDTRNGARTFNLATASASYVAHDFNLNLLDFSVPLRSQGVNRASSYLSSGGLMLRGADVILKRGASSYEMFAGTGVPAYFLSLSRVANAAGFTYHREFSSRLHIFSTSMFSNSGTDLSLQAAPFVRRHDFTVLNGVTWQPTKRFAMDFTQANSTRGSATNGSATYEMKRFDVYGAYSYTAQDFAFRDLRINTIDGKNLMLGGGYRINTKLRLNGFFQHHFANTLLEPTPIKVTGGNSFGANLQYLMTDRHQLQFSYSRNGGTRTGNTDVPDEQRFEILSSWLISQRIQNTAHYSLYSYGETAMHFDARKDFSLQDSVRYQWKPGLSLIGGLGYGHTTTSQLDRLRQQIALLDPQLQLLFQQDPVGFIRAGLLPQDIRSQLEAAQPTNVQLNFAAEVSRQRWSLSPTMQLNVNSGSGTANSVQFGYIGNYRLNAATWFQSSLTRQSYITPQSRTVQGYTQLLFGVSRDLNTNPVGWLEKRMEKHSISGRVFVDKQVSGNYHQGEPGMSGVRVLLDDGASAVTDQEGRFEFRGLSARVYKVSLPLEQFDTAVRVTSDSPRSVDLNQMRNAEVSFGVVNFARLIGMTFNDYTMTGQRQPDAPPMGKLRFTLSATGINPRSFESDNGGEFELSGLEPGHYTMHVEEESLPAGYYVERNDLEINIAPASASAIEVPIRAMRTVSGTIVFREKRDDPSTERPLAGVQLTADHTVTRSGADGSFILRNLPSGDFALRVLPSAGNIPAGVQMPSGTLHMKREPHNVEGVKIIITNPELLNFIVPENTLARKFR